MVMKRQLSWFGQAEYTKGSRKAEQTLQFLTKKNKFRLIMHTGSGENSEPINMTWDNGNKHLRMEAADCPIIVSKIPTKEYLQPN